MDRSESSSQHLQMCLNILLIVWCSSVILALVYSFYMARKKYRKITIYNKYDVVTQNQTYCIFTAYQIQVLKVMNFLMILKQMMNIMCIVAWNDYEYLWFSYEERHNFYGGKGIFTNCSLWVNKSLFQQIYMVLTVSSYLPFLLIMLLQIYEWMAILYILETQKNRRIEQIYFEHNAEVMRETESSDPQQLSYRKNERVQHKRMNQFLVFYTIVYLIASFCEHEGFMYWLIIPFLVILIIQIIVEYVKYRELI